MENKWFVYAILCDNGSVYIGQTNDLLQRWELHKKGKAAQWTKKFPPLRLFYLEEVDSQANALHRERELKKTTGRRMLKELLQKSGSQAGEPAEKLLERIKNEKLGQAKEGKIRLHRRKRYEQKTR
ncbi:MAG: GIY-YIG nuclease family protein [Deltaproteobacteria bacterium]|nr:GIY-YIG nuclease family protein [Deltaproteobacteria bacterium]